MHTPAPVFTSGLLLALAAATVSAEPVAAPAPAHPAATAVPAAAPVAASAGTSASATAAVPETTITEAPALTLEQRHQQELLENAGRLDRANHDLLARNQELQMQNENLSLQNNQLKHDRSSDGIWKGAFAVIIGFLMGWYFSGGSRRRSNW
jgi:hypothetical protein